MNYTSTVSKWASTGISGSRASMSSAPIFSDSSNSSYVRSWALTPDRSTSQPIHQSPSFLIIALYFMGESNITWVIEPNQYLVKMPPAETAWAVVEVR